MKSLLLIPDLDLSVFVLSTFYLYSVVVVVLLFVVVVLLLFVVVVVVVVCFDFRCISFNMYKCLACIVF